MISQKQRVLDKLNKDGVVDNFWAFHSYILRLGAIIFTLRQEGMNIDGDFGVNLGKDKRHSKNYYYTFKND